MSNAAPHPKFAYVGCFTSGTSVHHEYAKGDGISVFRIDPQTGKWDQIQICEAGPNPGFLVLTNNQKFLYACHGSASEMSSYAIDQQTGKLTPINRQPNHGTNAVHLTIDPTNRFIITANGPGVEVFPINADGSLAPNSDLFVPPSEKGRQKQPLKAHPHHVVFDPKGRYFVTPDHGVDKVRVFQLDTSNGKIIASKSPPIKAREGSAPRHIVFHPTKPYAYILNELECTVNSYKWDGEKGELTPFQVIARTPEDFTDDDRGGEIQISPSGNFVYESNRGHDSIVIYSVDQATGRLSIVGWESTQGKKPRHFCLDRNGNYLYAENVETDTLVIFTVDNKTGKLTPTGQVVPTMSPTCAVFTY